MARSSMPPQGAYLPLAFIKVAVHLHQFDSYFLHFNLFSLSKNVNLSCYERDWCTYYPKILAPPTSKASPSITSGRIKSLSFDTPHSKIKPTLKVGWISPFRFYVTHMAFATLPQLAVGIQLVQPHTMHSHFCRNLRYTNLLMRKDICVCTHRAQLHLKLYQNYA